MKLTEVNPHPEFEEPLLEDAREAVQVAEKVRDFVLRRLFQEVTK